MPTVDLKVLTFNVLAPVYANPSWYPAESAPIVQDTTRRRQKIIELLTRTSQNSTLNLAYVPDVIGLQEVTDDTDDVATIGGAYHRDGEYKYYVAALSKDYYCYFVPHAKTYWSGYFVDDASSPYAYTKNGNAVFLKKTTFSNVVFSDSANFTSGNHSVHVQATHTLSGKTLYLDVVHLDSDVGGNRANELDDILEKKVGNGQNATYTSVYHSSNYNANNLYLIVGDFNANTQQTALKQRLTASDMKNVIYQVQTTYGYPIFEQTHPFTGQYNGNNVYGPIDHIVHKNFGINPDIVYTSPPVRVHGEPSDTKTGVLDHNLWTVENESQRINDNFDYCGSDHFPVFATLTITY